MAKNHKGISKSSGQVPGTLVYIGQRKVEKAKITLIDYNEARLKEEVVQDIDKLKTLKAEKSVSWINVDGVSDVGTIEKIGSVFDLHSLMLEDVVNTAQRPKLEDFENYIFIVLKMLMFDAEKEKLESEQVSLVLAQDYVISFQETEGDVFGAIRERIRGAKGKIRKMGTDYLAYSLLDAVVDNYFVIMEKFGEKIENIEEALVKNPCVKTLRLLQQLKREAIFLRKSVWPLREAVNNLQRQESALIKKTTAVYLRDLYDHTIQVIDSIESLRDTISSMVDIYLSSVSNKMNEVMKVLTIFAVIFIPLTFVAGVYGMNFKYMPELNWRWGYFFALGIMVLIVVSMLIFFKKRKWF